MLGPPIGCLHAANMKTIAYLHICMEKNWPGALLEQLRQMKLNWLGHREEMMTALQSKHNSKHQKAAEEDVDQRILGRDLEKELWTAGRSERTLCPPPVLRRRRRQREAEEAVAYVLHDTALSWAQLRASPANRPQSERIWCSHVIGRATGDPAVYASSKLEMESHLGRWMPRTELLWLVCYLIYGQRGQTVKDCADEQSTGYSGGLCSTGSEKAQISDEWVCMV